MASLKDAVKNDAIPALNALLDEGRDVNEQDQDGMTPLHWAASCCRRTMVELLLARGANLEAKDARGETPLQKAAANGHRTVAELLIANGAEPDIFAAVLANRIDLVTAILQRDRSSARVADEKGLKVLHRAASSSCREIVQLLLTAGIDANGRDRSGSTPLHEAANCGQKEVAELLLANGGAVDAKDSGNRTPLHRAVEKNHEELVALLLAAGADVNSQACHEETPLHVAARIATPVIVRLLLQNGADVNARNGMGRSVLEVADPRVVGLLSEHGARRPDVSEIEARMRPGQWSVAGFLGPHESLEAVIAHDARTLSRLGVPPERIGDALAEVLWGKASADHWHVDFRQFMGEQECPWACASQEGGSCDFVIRNRRSGEVVKGGGLIVHLIQAHNFFEGLESPYRVEPEKLVRVLELHKS